MLYSMVMLFAAGCVLTHLAEQPGNPALSGANFKQSLLQSGGNMEGKEVRFGIGGSALTASVTSNTATGSYKCAGR